MESINERKSGAKLPPGRTAGDDRLQPSERGLGRARRSENNRTGTLGSDNPTVSRNRSRRRFPVWRFRARWRGRGASSRARRALQLLAIINERVGVGEEESCEKDRQVCARVWFIFVGFWIPPKEQVLVYKVPVEVMNLASD